jgi:hypothetical protein
MRIDPSIHWASNLEVLGFAFPQMLSEKLANTCGVKLET